jgi:2-keto-4-pentenoate hydratase/2-oxohepta-3-ene-1,7-dioic acid hydratase in catechol pathway
LIASRLAIIVYISAFTCLPDDGYLIATDTAGGIGSTRERPLQLKSGNEMALGLQKVGTQAKPVVAGTWFSPGQGELPVNCSSHSESISGF